MIVHPASPPWLIRTALALVPLMFGAFNVVLEVPLGSSAVRLSAADLIVPPLFAAVACLWWRTERGGSWRMGWVWQSLAGFSLCLTVSLAVGYNQLGTLSNWALFNKYLGWFILLGYFLTGAAVRVTVPERVWLYGLRAMVAVAILACLWAVVLFEAASMRYLVMIPQVAASPGEKLVGLVYGGMRMSGFLVNPNAFGLMLGCEALLLLPMLGRVFSPRVDFLVLAILMTCLTYSGGRASLGGFALGVVALALLRQVPWRQLAGAMVLTLCLMYLLNNFATLAHSVWLTMLGYVPEVNYTGYFPSREFVPNLDNSYSLWDRIETFRKALTMWLEAPFLGIGLGTYFARETATGIAEPQVIHNTWIWLLVELGPAAPLIMAGFLLAAFRCAWHQARRDHDPIFAGIAAILVLMAAMSWMHEILYQRQVWLLLGFALALRRNEQR